MKSQRLLLSIVIACLFATSMAGAADKWLHVRVVEDGEHGEKVRVNIPLDMVERMLPLIAIDELQHGKLSLDVDKDLEGINLRELAAALHDAPDAEFVTVESADEKVRVAKEGSFLIVRTEEQGERANERVRVRVPLAVVDALVGDDPHELDLMAALRVLGEYDDEPLVDIEDGDSSVKVWIDSSETGSGR